MLKIDGNIIEFMWAQFESEKLGPAKAGIAVRKVMQLAFVCGMESMYRFMEALPPEGLEPEDLASISQQIRTEIREYLIEHDLQMIIGG